MNKVEKQVAGIGGIVGGVGYLIAFVIVGSAEYTAATMADYISKDNFPVVIGLTALMFIGLMGMIRLAAGIRLLLKDSVAAQTYLASQLLSVGLIAAGWLLIVNASFAVNIGDTPAIDPAISYTFDQAGTGMVLLGGGLMLTSALVALFMASKGTLPKWLRVAALIMGIISITPFPGAVFMLALWPIVAGAWVLKSVPATD